MSFNSERRRFLKYLPATAGFVLVSTLGIKINPDEAFVIGKNKYSLKHSEAYGECGTAYDCAGGGGECGTAYDCTGGGRSDDGFGGGGECGTAYDCAGGGGECGTAYDCTGR